MTGEESEVEDGIPVLEANFLAATRAQALQRPPTAEETDEKEDLYL